MESIEIRVPAVPVGQPRPRAVAFAGKARMHEQTHIVKADGSRRPHPITAFKATVRLAVQQTYTGPPLQGPLRVDIDAVFPRLKSEIWKKRPMPRRRHTSKPDADNVCKACWDALNGIVFADDAQIAETTIRKFIAAGDEPPHVVIRVTLLSEAIDDREAA